MNAPVLSDKLVRDATAAWAAPELAVIVPTFNEAGNIDLLYSSLSAALAGLNWELIVVDDNSPDGTADVVKTLSLRYPNIRGIRRVGRRGLSSACIEGISATAAPFVAVMDADHQHDERILPQMLERAKTGADLVVGSRFAGNGSAGEGLSSTRLRGSQFATKLSALVTGEQISDPMSGFFLLRRDLFDQVSPKLSTDGFKILLDLIVTANRSGEKLRIAEVPYTFRPRANGESKMSALVVLQFLGLVFSKLTGGLLPASFLLFGLVGALGVVVHMTTLWFTGSRLGFGFVPAQITATIIAMTFNFILNNELTYANKKLRGWRYLTGLLTFYAVCSIGALANVSVASWIYTFDHQFYVAGLAGVLMSVVFNYSVTKVFTWR